jgi:hypothetical protein
MKKNLIILISLIFPILSCNNDDIGNTENKTPIKIENININSVIDTRAENEGFQYGEKLNVIITPNADKGYTGNIIETAYEYHGSWYILDNYTNIYMEDLFPSLMVVEEGFVIYDRYKITLNSRNKDLIKDQFSLNNFNDADYLEGYGNFRNKTTLSGELYHKNIFVEINLSSNEFDSNLFYEYLKSNSTILKFYTKDSDEKIIANKFEFWETNGIKKAIMFRAYIPLENLPLNNETLFEITDFYDQNSVIKCKYNYSITTTNLKEGTNIKVSAIYDNININSQTSISSYTYNGEWK